MDCPPFPGGICWFSWGYVCWPFFLTLLKQFCHSLETTVSRELGRGVANHGAFGEVHVGPFLGQKRGQYLGWIVKIHHHVMRRVNFDAVWNLPQYMRSWVVIYISDCTVYLPKNDFEAIAFWKCIQMYLMEIKIAMMFLEMARFWRRVFFGSVSSSSNARLFEGSRDSSRNRS